MKKVLLCISVMIGAVLMTAAQNNYSITHYGVKEGLSHQEARVIFEDSRGFIWIGTAFGLNMFDGQNFHAYYKIAGDSNSLSHNSIHTIAEDKQGRLWIGTQIGVSCFDLVKRRFINYNPAGHGIYQLDAEHCHVYIDSAETAWIGHNKGIVEMNIRTGKKKQHIIALEQPGENRNRYVNNFITDKNGTLWVSTSYGLYFKKKEHTFFASLPLPVHPYTKKVPAITRMSSDQHGTIYAGVWNGGLLKQNPDYSFSFIDFPAAYPANFTIFNITFRQQQAWLATSGGVLVLNENELGKSVTSNGFFVYDSNKKNREGENNYVTTNIICDSKGIFWCASMEGLNRVRKHNNFIQSFSYLPYSDFNVQAFAPFTDGSGVYFLSKERILSFRYSNYQLSALPGIYPLTYLRDICKGRNGYWLSTKNGLFFCDPALKNQVPVTEVNKGDDPLFFSGLLEDSKGRLWLAAAGRKGIRLYDPATQTLQSFFNNPAKPEFCYGKSIYSFTEDEEENIWIATTPLIRYRHKENRFEIITLPAAKADSTEANSVSAVFAGSNHKIWIGSMTGLFSYDLITQQFESIKIPAHIPPRIDGIAEDAQGNLWLSGTGGLIFYNRKEKTFKLFNQVNGLSSSNIGNELVRTPDGRIVFSFDGGIGLVNPAQVPAGKNIPAPQWTTIQLDNTPLPSDPAKTLTLRYNQSISFGFLSPDYSSATPNQYAYILEGLDKTWTEIGPSGTQRFSNLPPGKYTFKVKAGSNEGVWNEQALSFHFVVRPPFWQTGWFITGMVLLVAGISYAFYRNRLKQALQMERLRTRIATDLHDDIGATLSSVSMYSEAVKNQVKEKMPHLEPVLNKIGENSREMVTNMSDIVWAINPDNDNGKKLVQRMESYARDICAVKNVQLIFSGDKKLDELKLPLEHRKNIYLIFKEALNNALKYSMATAITIRIGLTAPQVLVLEVSDNGKGFNLQTHTGGNGLKNMQLRSEEIKAVLTISAGENKGVCIQLVCPLHK